MNSYKKLNLITEEGQHFYYRDDLLSTNIDELEEFLEIFKNINNLDFVKKVLFSHELQANNLVEGYGDDLAIIESVIKRKTSQIKDENQKKRILNLYRGYQYILKHRRINEESLKSVYNILSKDLLTSNELDRMGEYYRLDKVFILKNGRLDMELEEGVNSDDIQFLIEKYFDFINNSEYNNSITENYLKSQIMHFYLVYIHPYYDVNGRTSRTISLWELINKKAYPYIIFNRGIRGSKYDALIRECKVRKDLTKFLNYMLETVKLELEKEYIMESIASNTTSKLNSIDYQTLLYFLSMNGLKTVSDFATYYNYLNDKKNIKEIYNEMILPLIEKDVLVVERYTKNNMYEDNSNMVLMLNQSKIDLDSTRIRRIKL